MINFLIKAIPYLYMVLIWILSSLPTDAIIDTKLSMDHFIKESLHLVEFGILYLLFAFSLRFQGKLNQKSNIIIAFISISYGLIDEVHQSFVPYRSATLIDFVKDTIGVIVAYYFVNKKLFR